MLCRPIFTGVLAMGVLVGQNALFANGGLFLTQRGLYNVDDSQSKNRKHCPYCGGDHEVYACLRLVLEKVPHDVILDRLRDHEPSAGPRGPAAPYNMPRVSNTIHVTSMSRSNAVAGRGAAKAIGVGAGGAAAAAGAAVTAQPIQLAFGRAVPERFRSEAVCFLSL